MGGLLALAFAAGMIAPVNPCGFALLPAWITHALGDAASSPAPVRLLRSLRAGLAVTIGFAGTLALAGIAVSAGARSLIQAAPALGLAVGVVLVLFGAAMLAGRSFSLRLPGIPSRVTARPPSTARMVVFGVGYAAASLSRRIASLARYGPRITAFVLVLTGAYLAWYWYPAATGDAAASSRTNAVAGVATAVSGWVQGHVGVVTGVSVATVIVVLLIGTLSRRRRASLRKTEADCCAPEPARSADDRQSAETE